jgi:glycosyltransferase involved in cell wall biosynthesis
MGSRDMTKTTQCASAAPLFSIITPTYSRPDTFARAAASVSRQSFKDFEFIVVDDHSPHPYAHAICESLGIRHKVITNLENLGAAASRNRGITAARGKYISFLDDDDEYTSSFLESTYQCIKDSPDEVGLTWCSARYIDYPKTHGMPLIARDRIFDVNYCSPAALFEQLLSIGVGFGVTIKRNCFEKSGTFNENLRTAEDTDIFLRILGTGFVPKVVPGIHITLHNHNAPRLTGIAMHHRRISEGNELLKRHADFLARHPTIDKKIKDHIEALQKEVDCPSAA